MTENNPQNTFNKNSQQLETVNCVHFQKEYIFWQKQTEILRNKQQKIRRQSLNNGQIFPFLEISTAADSAKEFDCLKMKKKAVKIIFEKINNMTTIEEELAYWQQSTEKLRSRQQAFRKPKNLK